MLRSMYSGISGMKANQTKMDVVGNNVANVGTTSFKKSSTRFADALYQSAIYSSAGDSGPDNLFIECAASIFCSGLSAARLVFRYPLHQIHAYVAVFHSSCR